jgi:hypothetical protein
MKSKEEIKEIIRNSWGGTDGYYTYSFISTYPLITSGVNAVAEAAECFWFLDIVGSYQGSHGLDPEFQVWKLEVKDTEGVIRGYNDTALKVTHNIDYTDFPLEEFTVWVENGIILLPTEH